VFFPPYRFDRRVFSHPSGTSARRAGVSDSAVHPFEGSTRDFNPYFIMGAAAWQPAPPM